MNNDYDALKFFARFFVVLMFVAFIALGVMAVWILLKVL